MNYEESWRVQDEITTVVNAMGYSVWGMTLKTGGYGFTVTLNERLDEEEITVLCSQMPFSVDYDGVGTHGSVFSVYVD